MIRFISAAWFCVAVAAWGSDTRLAEAVQNQDKTAIRPLLKQRADVNGVQADGMTALIWAAHWGDLETLDLLLRSGASVKSANRYGITALSEACMLGNAPMIEKLLNAGADPNGPSPDGETPLMTASLSGNADAVKVLLAHGASVNTKESWEGESALMWAVNEGHHEVVRLLIDHGADVNAVARVSGLTRRTKAEGSRFQATRIFGGLTPLMFAARQGDVESARMLIAAGADIKHPEEDGVTPLLVAVNNGHFDTAALLLEKGADANDGSLYQAIDLRNQLVTDFDHPPPKLTDKLDLIGMIKLLLAHGADPNAINAKKAPARIVVNFFPEAAQYSALQRAARSTDAEGMRILLEHGGDARLVHPGEVKGFGPFPPPPAGATLLLMAVQGGGSPTEIYFGPPPTEMVYRVPSPDDKIEAVKLCLEHGADVNAANALGDTALHVVAQQGDDHVVQLLADHGAKLDAKNKKGLTALDLAAGKGGTGFGPPPPPRKSTVELIEKLMNSGQVP